MLASDVRKVIKEANDIKAFCEKNYKRHGYFTNTLDCDCPFFVKKNGLEWCSFTGNYRGPKDWKLEEEQ